ncbi:uncharacterized protein METZ01_LOCUS279816, partial [marine metagenome]
AVRPAEGARCDDRAQPHLRQRGPRGHRRRWGTCGTDEGRTFVHQGGHGPRGCRLRRRAFRSLLLPRQLAGRLRPDRRPHRARGTLRLGWDAERTARTVRPLRHLGRDQRTRRRSRSGDRAGRTALRWLTTGPTRRPHRRIRRLVVQPPTVQHGAVAPTQPRGRRRRVLCRTRGRGQDTDRRRRL